MNNNKYKFFDYKISKWSDNFFIINKNGKIKICIKHKNKIKTITLDKIIKWNNTENKLPIKLCFPQIIKNRCNLINSKFNFYIKKYKFKGNYSLIYPIKVNQQSYIIHSILKNNKYNNGLESGSKSELMCILINTKKKITILCNGYKDKKYIKLALIATQLGHKVYIIIEKIKEIILLIKLKKNNLKIGIRIKLNNLEIDQNKNKYQIKFGLNSIQIIRLINILKKFNLTKKCELIHCHIKSQINKINNFNKFLREFINIYIDLIKIFNLNIKYLNIGGGLAVNYSGIKYINYTLDTYISNIIKLILIICRKNKIKTPNIITESGRYITAHHEILITNIINIEKNKTFKIKNLIISKNNKKNIIFKNLWNILNKINKKKIINFNNIKNILIKTKKFFQKGFFNILEKSWIEKIYFNILYKINKKKIITNNKILNNINLFLSDKIHLNISIFRSIPDTWGIKQIFPILPIKKLNKPISKEVHISDITCDYDGKINKYIHKNKIQNTLPIQNLNKKKLPPIGLFMIGAYQNTLGNKHNLFGNIETWIIYLKNKNKYKKIIINLNSSLKKLIKFTNLNQKKIIFFLKKNKKIKKKIIFLLKNKTYLE